MEKKPEIKTPQEFIGTKLMYENTTIFSIRENGHCQPIVDIRGWGAIQNMFKDKNEAVDNEAACNFQDSVGEHIKAAIESYERLQAENKAMREILKDYERKLNTEKWQASNDENLPEFLRIGKLQYQVNELLNQQHGEH